MQNIAAISSEPPTLSRGRQALVRALYIATAKGVRLKVKTSDGYVYRTIAPIIIGNNFLQFATPQSDDLILVLFKEIEGLEV